MNTQQQVCPGEQERRDEEQSGDANISQLLGGRGLDFPQRRLESSNGIVSLVVEKGSEVVTPAEGLREGEWELLSYNVGPPSTALTTTAAAAMKSVEHFSKTACLRGAINPTVNNGIKSLLACCDSIRECLVALLVGE